MAGGPVAAVGQKAGRRAYESRGIWSPSMETAGSVNRDRCNLSCDWAQRRRCPSRVRRRAAFTVCSVQPAILSFSGGFFFFFFFSSEICQLSGFALELGPSGYRRLEKEAKQEKAVSDI